MNKLNRRKFIKNSSTALAGFVLTGAMYDNILSGRKMKVGQIGTRHSHADEKISTIKKLDDIFELVGVVEENHRHREEAKKKYEFSNVNWIPEKALLNTPGLDAVIVETDFLELLPTAMKCVNAGVHVHIDKPPGRSLSGLKELFKVAESNNLIVQMGYMFRYNTAFQFCLEAVKSGLLGEILQIDGVISKKISNQRRINLAQSYGGSMMLLGCHLIDMLIALCGRPEKVNSFNNKTREDKDDLFDNELAVLEYPNFAATIRSSLVEVEGMKRRQFVISGSKGTLEIKPLEPAVLNLALEEGSGIYKKGYQQINLPKSRGRYVEQLMDFANQIQGEKTGDYSFEHDILVHEALLKASKII